MSPTIRTDALTPRQRATLRNVIRQEEEDENADD